MSMTYSAGQGAPQTGGDGTPPPATALHSEAPDRTGPAEPVPVRLHHFFERSRAARPDAVALVCGGEKLAYADLDALANRLAHYLARRGVRPGDSVGLLL